MSWAETPCPRGKKKYLSWAHADRDARAMRRSGKRSNAKPFHCTTCHHAHVGGE